MKILWITNLLFPEATSLLKGNNKFKTSGGWMLGAAQALLAYKKDINLIVASVSTCVKKLTIIRGKQITYYIIPYGKGNLKYNKEYEKYWEQINKEVQPDIIHIHGSEFTHGLAFVKVCGNNNVVVSIQGLKSIYARYFFHGIPKVDQLKYTSISDFLHGTSMYTDYKKYKESGKYEIELLQSVKNIIGRTSWDKAHSWALNPNAKYYFCNETLRDAFYNAPLWEYKKCNPHTIFLSQAGYSIKGLHQILKAIPLVLRHYPDTSIRIAGNDITLIKQKGGFLHIRSYGNMIKQMIQKNNLADKIHFLGKLDENEMKDEYLKCNVFICPSSIENSPNSLGEAQILGVPCLGSYVGGIPDMMQSNEEHLYRFDETEILAYKICHIFQTNNTDIKLQQLACQRHNKLTNAKQLYSIYKNIMTSHNEN